MSSFKFGFSGDPDESDNNDSDNIEWLKSEKIVPCDQIKDIDNIATQAKMFACGDAEIGYVVISNMMTYIKERGLDNVVELANHKHSDLVTGTYEGDEIVFVFDLCGAFCIVTEGAILNIWGLKIWECTYDLVEYLEENPEVINFQDLKVLDLGCGAGILGIYAFLKGAFVTFQDYNKEILEISTIPNVLLNIEEDEREEQIRKCKFYSGDWASFDTLLEESDNFDVILTAETIYNEKNYNKLLSLIRNRLDQNGIVLVGAKTYYFAVGGGTRQFENVLKNFDLASDVVWKTNIGIQREILKIKKL